MTVWDALIGQEAAVAALQAAARDARARVEGGQSTGALSHAWLVTGPPGSGRSVAAQCLAAALQCTGDEVGCGECPGCRTTMAGTNPDVADISTDLSQFKIDEVRGWVADSYMAPSQGRWRVTLVQDADRMSERTSNVILKAVEEPAERGVWMLCAPTADEVLPTIRSRTRSLVLRTPTAQAVAKYLADTEGASMGRALQAAKLAQSHVGLARALLLDPDLRAQRRALFEPALDARTVGEAVVAAGRVVDAAKSQSEEATARKNEAQRAALLSSLGIEEGKRVPPALRAQVRQMEQDQDRRGKRALTDLLDRALLDLLGFFRDVAAVQLRAETSAVHVDMAQRVVAVADASSMEQTLACVDALNLARKRLQTNAAPLLVVEAAFVALQVAWQS